MDIILVPGLWLDGSSWDAVVPALEAAGHAAHALTLPGLESRDADRSGITLEDHVTAVVDAIDAASGPVVLVGHSGGCGIAYGALDRRVDRVSRAILIGGFPTADGDVLLKGFTAENGEVALPDWSTFDDADLGGLDPDALQRFRERAIPSPEHVVSGIQHLGDERRYEVPLTAVATEYSVADLQDWVASGEPSVQEFAHFRDVAYVDLPTGHWPQFTRPDDLARTILEQPPLSPR